MTDTCKEYSARQGLRVKHLYFKMKYVIIRIYILGMIRVCKISRIVSLCVLEDQRRSMSIAKPSCFKF